MTPSGEWIKTREARIADQRRQAERHLRKFLDFLVQDAQRIAELLDKGTPIEEFEGNIYDLRDSVDKIARDYHTIEILGPLQ